MLKQLGFVVGPDAHDISQVAAKNDICGPDDVVLHAQLDNSEKLDNLDSLLGHLEGE